MEKELRRILRYEREWLKRNHPEIFKQMEQASEENTQQHYAKCIKRAGCYMANTFGYRPKG